MAVRTTRAGWLARALVAPYWVNYHLEHHLVMHVPCYRLPKVHALMLDKGYGDKMRVARSYRSALVLGSAFGSLSALGGFLIGRRSLYWSTVFP